MPATIDPARQFERARRALMRSDPRLARVIRASGARRPSFQVREPFRALVGAVVSQQLSTRAADTIQQRLEALVPTLSPTALDTVPDGALRTIGLSGQKVSYLRDLAARVTDGRLDLDHLSTLDDAAVTDAIVAVRGFGVWSAQMFLIFALHRPDIFPTGDLGIVKGCQRVLGMKSRPAVRTMVRAAARWAPYRSTASWYLWRATELPESVFTDIAL
ncbi:MAG: DNA-3-methyladenine glycosylase 2 family protein [Acidobacteria bacterium]|nr:DNA-3-methyladenine glycosylase 2 family protein [Acidobacteriota bacterium]